MSSVRLFILDALERRGDMHGHQLRQLAGMEHVDNWTDITVGGLYGALKRLGAEGLIEPVRTEQVGGYPERQVWGITAAGRISLKRLRADGLREVVFRPDPFDLALARFDRSRSAEVPDAITARLAELRSMLADEELRGRRAARFLSPIEARALTHKVTRLSAEIDWHEALIAALPELLDAEATWKEPHPHD